MDTKAEPSESCHGERPYSPSDVTTYDLSSDESVTKAQIEFRSITKSSSSISDSDDDSTSSYEYHWEEAKPPKPPFEPFVISVNIGSTKLPAIRRERISIIPLKAVFQKLLPSSSPAVLKAIDKLGIHQLTKFEADLLTNRVEGWRPYVLPSQVDNEARLAGFRRGDVACSCESIKEAYFNLARDAAIGLNNGAEKEGRFRDRIGIKKYSTASVDGLPNPTSALHLKSSDSDNDTSKENLLPHSSSTSSLKMYCVNQKAATRKMKADHAGGDRKAEALTEENEDASCLNQAMSQQINSKNERGGVDLLTHREDCCSSRNAVVLSHLYPEGENENENENEDFDVEINQALANARRTPNLKTHGGRTANISDRVIEKLDRKEGENGDKCELLRENKLEDSVSPMKANWEVAPTNISNNLRAHQDSSRLRNHGEKVSSSVSNSTLQIVWNTPKIAAKRNTVSVLSDYTSSTSDTDVAPAPTSDETSFSAGLHISQSQSPPSNLSSSNQPRDIIISNETAQEFDDSGNLESVSAGTSSYECKNLDHDINLLAQMECPHRFGHTASHCAYQKDRNSTHKPNSIKNTHNLATVATTDYDSLISSSEKQDRRDLTNYPSNVEILTLSLPANPSTGRRKKVHHLRAVSKKAAGKPLASSVDVNGKERRRSTCKIVQNSGRALNSRERENKSSRRRKSVSSEVTELSLRRRNTKNPRPLIPKKILIDDSSSEHYAPTVSPRDMPSVVSGSYKDERRSSGGSQVISHEWTTNYSKLRYTYDSAIYSPISSAEGDFGSDSCDAATRRANTRKVLRRRSARSRLRKPNDKCEERRKSADNEIPKSSSCQGAIKYPITRIDNSKGETSSMSVIPSLYLCNPSDSRLKANVENLLVSIRSQCDRDVSVVENRSRGSSRRVFMRRSLDRKRSSKQRIRRRSHSPYCLTSVSPVTLGCQAYAGRRRSLSPVCTRYSREKGNASHEATGMSTKMFRRHQRDSMHSYFYGLVDNERSRDKVGNRLAGTHDSETRYSSTQKGSRKISHSQDIALYKADVDKYHDTYSVEQSSFSDVKGSALNDSGDKLVRERKVCGRLDSRGRAAMAYELLPPNETALEEEEIVIFKKRNPLEECWPFLLHNSDEYMSPEDENRDDEGCFMIGKLTASMRDIHKTMEVHSSERIPHTNSDNIEATSNANLPTVAASASMNQKEVAKLSKTGDYRISFEVSEHEVVDNAPEQSLTEAGQTSELSNETVGIVPSITVITPQEISRETFANSPENSNGAPGVEVSRAKPSTVVDTEVTNHSIEESPCESALACTDDADRREEKGVRENAATVLAITSNHKSGKIDETCSASPPPDNFHTDLRQRISPAIEVTATVASPCAYEEVAVASDHTIDEVNSVLIDASAFEAKFTQHDDVSAIASENYKTVRLTNDRQQIDKETSLIWSAEVESGNNCEINQDGMCLGATITVEDDKCSRTTPRYAWNGFSDVKSWKKKLLRKAQTTAERSEGDVESTLNQGYNGVNPNIHPSEETVSQESAVASLSKEAVRNDKSDVVPVQYLERYEISSTIPKESPVCREGHSANDCRKAVGSRRNEYQKQSKVDERDSSNSYVRSCSHIVTATNNHSTDPNNPESLHEHSFQARSTSELLPAKHSLAIKLEGGTSAAKSTVLTSQYKLAHITTTVANFRTLQEGDQMSPVSTDRTNRSNLKCTTNVETTSPSKDANLCSPTPTSQHIPKKYDDKVHMFTNIPNSSISGNVRPSVSSPLTENSLRISENVPHTVVSCITQQGGERIAVSTDGSIVPNLKVISSETAGFSSTGNIMRKDYPPCDSVKGSKDDKVILPVCASETANSVSKDSPTGMWTFSSGDVIIPKYSSKDAYTIPQAPSSEANAFKSNVVASEGIISSSQKHLASTGSQISTSMEIPTEYEERFPLSIEVMSKSEQEKITEVTNIFLKNSTVDDCSLSSTLNMIYTKRDNAVRTFIKQADQSQATRNANSSTGVENDVFCKDPDDSLMFDLQQVVENSALANECTAGILTNDSVASCLSTNQEKNTQINYSISGLPSVLQSSCGSSSSCLSSSRIFAAAASSITIVNQPPAPVGLSNKSAFRGPSINLKSKRRKTILSKPWENNAKPPTANASQSFSFCHARSGTVITATNTSPLSVSKGEIRSRHQHETGHNYGSQSRSDSKPLKSILLNRNKNFPRLHYANKLQIPISNFEVDDESASTEASEVVTDVGRINVRKYAPNCSRKRRTKDQVSSGNGSKTKRIKSKLNVNKKPQALLTARIHEVVAMHGEVAIGDGEFAAGDEMICDLLPLIKTKSKPRAKKKSDSAGSRGRPKRRGRLPSISSDEDIIEELSATTQQPLSKGQSNTQPENDSSKTEDDDSDDGLVSFMGIIRSSDAVVPIVPDMKLEAESDPVEGDLTVITDSESGDFEAKEDLKRLCCGTLQDPPVKPGSTKERETDGVGNIFAKFSREMEEMNELQHSCNLQVAVVQDQKPTLNQADINIRKLNFPSSSEPLKGVDTGKVGFSSAVLNGEAIDQISIAGESSHKNMKVIEPALPIDDASGTSSVPLTIDSINPNLLTPPTSPKSDDNAKRLKENSVGPKFLECQQDGKLFAGYPAQSSNEKGNDTVNKSTKNIMETRDTSERTCDESKGNATGITNLIAAAAAMAGVPTSMATGPVDTVEDLMRPRTYVREVKDSILAINSLSSLHRKSSRPGIAKEQFLDIILSERRSCHGFLEICLYGFDDPDKVTYALRRIPYVRTTPYADGNEIVTGEEESCESCKGASSTIATYLRLRDVISLLKVNVESLYSLTTRCGVTLFPPSGYMRDLFATVYDPVGKSDPIIAKMTWRNAFGEGVQEFLDHMIVLDKFLHSILPRFYVEALQIRTSDVPNFVNVKIFKPIFEINEEVVKIFRKPYEYNAVLMKKDHDLQTNSMKKRKFCNATPFTAQGYRKKATKCEEIERLRKLQSKGPTIWKESRAQKSLAARAPVAVAPRFASIGLSSIKPPATLKYSSFADFQQFQNPPSAEMKSARNHIGLPHCDASTRIMPTAYSVDCDVRANKTVYSANMMQLSRMGCMISNEAAEYMRRTSSMFPLPTRLKLHTTLSRSGMPIMSNHENRGQPIVQVNVPSMAHLHVRSHSNVRSRVDCNIPENPQHFSNNTIARTSSSTSTLQASRENAKGSQTCHLRKVTKNGRSSVSLHDDDIEKPRKHNLQSTRTTRKSSAPGSKSTA